MGNDFIPHLPNMHIHIDSVSSIFNCYNKFRSSVSVDSFLIQSDGTFNAPNLKSFLIIMKDYEDKLIFDSLQSYKKVFMIDPGLQDQNFDGNQIFKVRLY